MNLTQSVLCIRLVLAMLLRLRWVSDIHVSTLNNFTYAVSLSYPKSDDH